MTKDEQWLLKEKYGGEKTEGFFADCERLARGEPLGYVIGWVPFLDCKIGLDSHPLIPRPETEFWVEHAIKSIKQTNGEHCTVRATNLNPTEGNPREIPRVTLGGAGAHAAAAGVDSESAQLWLEEFGWDSQGAGESSSSQPRPLAQFGDQSTIKVLDLCAGSGAIGVAVAKQVPMARVDFGEIDARHQPTIIKNLTQNLPSEWKAGNVWVGDLFAALPAYTPPYDFILTNPPYIDPALDRTEVSVKDFEPHLALYGGQDGMALIAQIITEAPGYLTLGGQLWLEHEPEQSNAIQTLAAQQGFTATTHCDQYNTERYSILVLQ